MTEFVNFDFLILIRLTVATILGGIIGLERGGNHDAGLRTHIVVCLGAASVMVVSECLVKQYGIPTEIMRMGAQVISGVGFLGVGSIIVDGNRVRGITTAAGLWTTACVGLAVGSGFYLIAIIIVTLMIFAMLGLRSFALRLKLKAQVYNLKVELDDINKTGLVIKKLIERKVQIKSVKLEENDLYVSMLLGLTLPKNNTVEELMKGILEVGGVREVKGV